MEELAEWEAFYFFEPWGAPAEDDRWRNMYSLYFSVNAKSGTPQPDWLDRDPEETARRRIPITLEDKLLAFVEAWAIDGDVLEADVIDIEVKDQGTSPPS